jgi:hypothetical protein
MYRFLNITSTPSHVRRVLPVRFNLKLGYTIKVSVITRGRGTGGGGAMGACAPFFLG